MDMWRLDVHACALVCRAWVPYCQSLLFRKLVIYRPTAAVIYSQRRLLQHAPHLRSYVREFEVREPPQPDAPAYPFFLAILARSFPSLCKISLIWAANPPYHCHRVFCGPIFKAPSITTLYICEILLRDPSNLYDTVTQFPNLQTLYLDGIAWLMPRLRGHRDGSRTSPMVLPRKSALGKLPAIARLSVGCITSLCSRLMDVCCLSSTSVLDTN